jgi:hypothetical protein
VCIRSQFGIAAAFRQHGDYAAVWSPMADLDGHGCHQTAGSHQVGDNGSSAHRPGHCAKLRKGGVACKVALVGTRSSMWVRVFWIELLAKLQLGTLTTFLPQCPAGASEVATVPRWSFSSGSTNHQSMPVRLLAHIWVHVLCCCLLIGSRIT